MAFQLGREISVEADGKVWRLPRLEYEIVLAFRDWIAEREGDPFADVKELAATLDAATVNEMVREAKEIKKQLQAFSIGSPLAKRYLTTEIGATELFYLLLRQHQPDVARAQAMRVVVELAQSKGIADVLAKLQGAPPAEKNADAPAA